MSASRYRVWARSTDRTGVSPTGGFCTYTYSIWWNGANGNPGAPYSVNLSVGSPNCPGPIFVEIARLLPGGGKQIVAYSTSSWAEYKCQGTATNTYQSVGTLDGTILTMPNVPCS
jgi:hypothetical protein